MNPPPDETPETRLPVRLTPRASANAACCAFMADLLGLRPSHVSVSHGHKSRNEVLAIMCSSEEMVQGDLAQ